MNISTKKSLLGYGIASDLIEKLAKSNLNVSKIKTLDETEISKLGKLSIKDASVLKKTILRKQIDTDVLRELLYNSNYTCCICKGSKSKSYIVHHIEEYSVSQNNKYENLAVLCPADHDLAHGSGGLSSSISKKEIIDNKIKWEDEAKRERLKNLTNKPQISDLDYANIPRIEELLNSFQSPLDLSHLDRYQVALKDFLDLGGHFDIKLLLKQDALKSYPFDFHHSVYIKIYYQKLFEEILQYIEFRNMNDFLNVKDHLNQDLIGTYCYYQGALYGKRPKLPISNTTEPIKMYFRKRGFMCTWMVDPKYMFSSTSITRISDHSIYLVYGKIRGMNIVEKNGKKLKNYDIRPYILSMPKTILDMLL